MRIIKGESIGQQHQAWGVPCKFEALTVAPQIIKYKFKILDYLKINKLKKLCEPLAAWTGQAAEITTTAGGFFVELVREVREFVDLNTYSETLESAPPYTLPLGTSTDGQKVAATLDSLTHLLVAGTTGGGKSVILNNFILAACSYNNPQRLGLVLIDLKRVEFSKFRKLPHLVAEVVTEPEQARETLAALVELMEARYKKLETQHGGGKFKKILIIIDELTDLVQQAPECKKLLTRLLQKARACGLHFIVATQSPRATILDGATLANLPSRLALKCASARESVLILGHKGAELLTGCGDCIFKAQSTTKEQRLQAPHLTAEQIKNILY